MVASFRKVAFFVLTAVLLGAVSLVPLSFGQISGPITLQPTIIPPVNEAILKDPSGTYVIYNATSSRWSMNLTSYEKLLHDPYSIIPAGLVQIIGNMAFVTTQSSSATYAASTNVSSNYNWSGAGGCDGRSMSVTANGPTCNGSKGSLGTAGVYTASLTWIPKCFSGSSCVTAFWAGLSTKYTATGDLVQNGIAVCVSNSWCSGGGSKGKTSWVTWWEVVPQYNSRQPTAIQPATINGSVNEFDFAFSSVNEYMVGLEWQIGSWNYALGATSNYPQTAFWQAEAIMEAPSINTVTQIPLGWTPNPNTMVGWWETGQYCGCTYAGGNMGSSYAVVLYDLYSSSNQLMAYGTITSTYQFSDTYK